jgi:hypothetical protein
MGGNPAFLIAMILHFLSLFILVLDGLYITTRAQQLASTPEQKDGWLRTAALMADLV